MTDGYGNSRIVKFNARGDYVLDWGQRGTSPGDFHTPHVITIGADDLLYVTDRENDRIQVFDAAGSLHSIWPNLHSVDGLYVAPDGLIYGSAGIDNALLCFKRDGQLLDTWIPEDSLNYPHAVAVDAKGAIYAAETGDRWVVTGPLPGNAKCCPVQGLREAASENGFGSHYDDDRTPTYRYRFGRFTTKHTKDTKVREEVADAND